VKRSAGKSAVAAAAYRAAERLHNKYDGVTHDYSRRRGVVFTDIILPSHAPKSFRNREELWNSVEKIEKASNSQLAREVEFSLPNNLNRKTQIQMVCRHVRSQFVEKGMCADIAIHDKGDGNPHAHVLLTMRPLEKDGKWGMKSKRDYVLDKDGQRIRLKSGDYKTRKIRSTDWDDRGNAEKWHEAWAFACNRELERVGSERRVTNQSYADQGLLIEPTKHLGWEAHQIAKKGGRSRRNDENHEIMRRNASLLQIRQELKELGGLEHQEIQRLENLEADRKKKLEFDKRAKLEAERQKKQKIEEQKIHEKARMEKQRALEQNVRMEKEKPRLGLQTLYSAPPTKPEKPASVQPDKPSPVQVKQTKEAAPAVVAKPEPAQPVDHIQTENKPIDSEKVHQNLTLFDIRSEYIELEIEIKEQMRLGSDLRDSLRRLDSKYEDLTESVQIIRDYDEQIKRLRQQRRDLAPTALKERKMIDGNIEKLINSKEQAQGYLSREHGISDPSKLQEKYHEINRDRAEARKQQAALKDLKQLAARQRELEESYKCEHSKGKPIRSEDSDLPKKMKLVNRVAMAEAENRLKKLTEPDRQSDRDKTRDRRK